MPGSPYPATLFYFFFQGGGEVEREGKEQCYQQEEAGRSLSDPSTSEQLGLKELDEA